jgi:hypothetical protein
MSPETAVPDKKIHASNNIYTVVLALALYAVVATVLFVAFKCQSQYGTIFGIP